jgi:hypothetical protein
MRPGKLVALCALAILAAPPRASAAPPAAAPAASPAVTPADAPAASPAVAPAAAPPAVTPEPGYLERVLRGQPERFQVALDPALAAGHRVQILVSFVERDGRAFTLERHGFRADAEYFYPASAIKLCAAVAALQTMRALVDPAARRRARKGSRARRLDLDTPLVFHPLFPGERRATDDSSNLAGGRITLGHLIRQMIIVSSNEAFNRLYDLVGHHAINEMMWSAGLRDTYFFHRLSVLRGPEEQRRAPRVDFETRAGVVTIPARQSDLALAPRALPGLDVGERYIEGKREVAAPMSFAQKNRISLLDLQNLLIMVMRPDIPLGLPGFSLHEDDRAFLQRALREPPAESRNPVFPPEEHDVLRFKPVMGGLLRVAPPARWAVWSKAGTAYGFRIENAYVVDQQRERAMFLTVAIYANADGTLNDDRYDYDRVSDPFIHDLAEAVVRDRWKLRGAGRAR